MAEKSFAEKLKDLREKKKLTRTQVANDLNIKYTTIANYENGSREPSFAVLKTLANYYKVSTDYLVGNSIKTTKMRITKNQKLEPTIKEVSKCLKLALQLLQTIYSKGEADE